MLGSQKSRRTKQQKEQDETCAKAAAVAVRDKAKADEYAVLSCIAHLEDLIESREQTVQENSQRPDQHCIQPTDGAGSNHTRVHFLGPFIYYRVADQQLVTAGNNGSHLESSDSDDVTKHWDKENHQIMTPLESSELCDSSSDLDFQAANSKEEGDSGSGQVESEDAMSVVVESPDTSHAMAKKNAVNTHQL
jgi:hypothetical protein